MTLRFGDVPATLSAEVRGDAGRLRQMVGNLVRNAIKFTPKGGAVDIQVESMAASHAGRCGVRITVNDTGIGIAEADLAKLFRPFVQAESYQTRQQGGTGLGLAIVKKMAEHMQGTAGGSSRLGRAQVFGLRLRWRLGMRARQP